MKRQLAALVLAVLQVSTPGLCHRLTLAATSFVPQPGRARGASALNGFRLARGLALLFATLIAFSVSQRPAQAAGSASIFIAPATATAGVGADVALDVDASNVSLPGLGGYVIVLQWNPAVLSLTSLVDSGWVTSGQIIVFCTTPTIDNTNGTAELDCTPLYGFGNGVTTSGPQALAYATFHANAAGTSTIDLSGSSLVDPSSVAIPSTITNGSVTVPGSVGGIAEAPDMAALPQRVRAGGRSHGAWYAGAGVLLAATMLGAGATAWKRRSRARGGLQPPRQTR